MSLALVAGVLVALVSFVAYVGVVADSPAVVFALAGVICVGVSSCLAWDALSSLGVITTVLVGFASHPLLGSLKVFRSVVDVVVLAGSVDGASPTSCLWSCVRVGCFDLSVALLPAYSGFCVV